MMLIASRKVHCTFLSQCHACPSLLSSLSRQVANPVKNNDAILYLQKYGYLDINAPSLSTNGTSAALKHAISLFQEYYQLPGEAVLNNVTLQLMRKPRCGLEDIRNHAFSPLSTKWPKTHLTWNFHLADKNILRTTEAAFALWAANSSLTFKRVTLNPDILISFRDSVHTNVDQRKGVCSSSLDGPGGVLAHAFYPTGELDYVSEHVDREERWHILLNENPPNTLYLLHTLVHEIGHSLGLAHSTRGDSVMFAYVPNKTFPVKLSIEDILAVQHLYGTNNSAPRLPPTTPPPPPRTTTTTTTTMTTAASVTPSEPESIDLCALQRVDAVLILNHRIFIAYQRYVWSISLIGRTYDKPLLLTDYMKFLPTNFTRLSAVYQRPTGDIVLFANYMVYLIKYPSFTLASDWPKTYADMRLPQDAKINAAIDTNKGRTFIIYNDRNVAELDECTLQCMTFNTLQAIFPGIPHGVTSAFRNTDGNIYFISKRNFYKFNEFTKTITTAGRFDLQIIGVVCPRDSLLRQLQELLSQLVHYSKVFTNMDNLEEEEAQEYEEQEGKERELIH